MSNPLKISARVDIDASRASQGAKVAKDAVASIGGAADMTTSKLQKLIATSVGLHDGAANNNQRQWVGALASESLAIDTLRAKYNPLFAVIQQYKAAQVEIRTAHAMGALSSAEMSAALSRERQETLASIDAIKGRNAAIAGMQSGAGAGRGVQGFQTANLAFQLQDIGSTAAFMPWWTVALQQGPQVSAVLSTMENKAAGLAAAFSAVVSPLSLVTIGVIGAGAAAIQYFSSMSNAAEEAQAELEAHNEIIRRAADLWGDATPALKAYVDELDKADKFSQGRQAGEALAGIELEGLSEKLLAFRMQFAEAVRALNGIKADPAFIRDFSTAFGDLREKLEGGTASFNEVNNAQKLLADAVGTYGVKQVLSFRDAFDDVSAAIYRGVTAAQQARTAWIAALAGGTNVQDIIAKSAATFADNGKSYTVNQFKPQGDVPTPDRRPLIELDGLPGSHKAGGGKGLVKTYEDIMKSADQRIAQMRVEFDVSGQTGVAAETLRFKLELLNQVEETGRALTPKQVEKINDRVEAFKKYGEAAAKAKLHTDLLFAREQLGRSSFDQQIASQMKSLGMEVDFDSYTAGLIRTNLQLEYARDLAGDFASTFISGITEGESVWEAFGDAGVSALRKISDTLLNDVLNSLFQVNGAAGSSGGIFANLLGGLFGGGATDPWAGLRGYDGGGYTGPGPIHQPKGLVHAGEVVFSQADVSRHGGVANVEAIRKGLAGYAAGGAVGVAALGKSGNSHTGAAPMGGGGSRDFIDVRISFDEDWNPVGRLKEVARQEAAPMIRQGFAEYDRGLPGRFRQIQSNPRKA